MTVDTSVEETTAESALDNEATEPQTPPETPEPEENAEAEEEGGIGEDAPADKPNSLQIRINKITREKHEFRRLASEKEREAEYWRGVAEGRIQPKGEAPKQEPKGPPKPADFGQDHEAYVRALVRYENQQANEQSQQEAEAKAAEKAQQEKLTSFISADAEYQDNNAEYRGAQELGADPTFPITQPMLDAIVESDNGPALLHYLDTHRDEAYAISQMSPAKSAVALGKVAAKLETPVQPAPTKPVSNAPSPVPTVKPSAPARKKPEDMSMDEFIKWRQQK